MGFYGGYFLVILGHFLDVLASFLDFIFKILGEFLGDFRNIFASFLGYEQVFLGVSLRYSRGVPGVWLKCVWVIWRDFFSAFLNLF